MEPYMQPNWVSESSCSNRLVEATTGWHLWIQLQRLPDENLVAGLLPKAPVLTQLARKQQRRIHQHTPATAGMCGGQLAMS